MTTFFQDVVKEGRSFGKVLKDRENDLVKAMEVGTWNCPLICFS